MTPQTPGAAAHGAAATPGQHLAVEGKPGRGRMDGDSGGVETAAVPPCTRLDPEMFFPDAHDLHGQRQAARVCATCSVKDACYAKAVKKRETDGVWGGVLFNGTKRRKVAVTVPAPPPPPRPVPVNLCPVCGSEMPQDHVTCSAECRRERRRDYYAQRYRAERDRAATGEAAPPPTGRTPLRTVGGQCKRGHVLVGENIRTRWDRPGVITCRECERDRKRTPNPPRDPVAMRQSAADSRARRAETRYGRDVCPVCRQMVALTAGGTVRRHGPKDATCAGSNSWPVAEKRAAS